ncbi:MULTISPECIES: glycerol kinase GlpK [Rhizobium/Agrobacterium group]|uniref:Glycerol kinase n=2 Tax=Rhizobium/Agrobacterium group TaxID=227290 RepID=GLPK_ALLAM|nr:MULTISPECIES: glycerol kinase GlpK [Rhizobium/Agrobacterium group]B9JZR4.1 RecName: Full=Glycerol kinase; AltName: Full=ATP:glycerol 3-phosphotransferase; AltName: Full=Glycerokinase; Short=GK [Allorhizobium ampelinum S4]ACM37374.1 glycerol kinase [Allorhizobium ampelinum S4]MUO30108.1 glycerol kinase GlpK [Agrobacterium vitis]MUO45150.1 glycerol kinase GlpK [Agrobacterium vitis]MUP12793.1 glycerol kinase GlpK [Agrobacterium vitis]
MGGFVLAIDQGTTSSRAIVFDGAMRIVGTGQKEFPQIFPQSGWVEHDPDAIWDSVVSSIHDALARARITAGDLAAIGITNQRETVVVWDKDTGKPIHNAIVWQDRRTSAFCETLKRDGLEATVTTKTGLLLDPYFSGTKLSWLLDHVEGARARAEQGGLCFGTVDTYLIWRLTGGKSFVTDATNASRTLIFNIAEHGWDEELLALLNIPAAMLPEVKDCAADFGVTDKAVFGAAVPILGVAGDQQAATIGQACFAPGMVKSTYGTGCFALLNTGADRVVSKSRLLTTIAYRMDGKTTYALEGSIFIAGAAVQWLRDGLKVIGDAAETGRLAAEADPGQPVYLVPAFTGLGAPWWDPDARGALFGLTRNTGPAELARAALEAVCYQTRDLLDAMHKDWQNGEDDMVLRVDGGMAASDWTMQRLADLLDAPVDRPSVIETTALGAAFLAASRVGLWPGMDAFARAWARDHRFEPVMDAETRTEKLRGWRDAVRRTLTAG